MEAAKDDVLPIGMTLTLNEIARSHMKKEYGSIKVITHVSDVEFKDLVDDLLELGMQVDCREISREDDFVLSSCTAVRQVRRLLISGNFFVLQKKPFLYFITGERNPFFGKILLNISRDLYPELLRTYVTSEDLYGLLTDFSKAKRIQLRYTEFVYKRMFGDAFSDRRHEKRLDPYKHKEFSDAFKKAREQGGKVDRIRVFGDGYSFRVSRSGILRLYQGDFSEYYRFFICRIAECAASRWKVFEKRARKELPQKEVLPILVNFDSSVFEDLTTRKQLLQVIADYSNCEYSIIHGTNPHVYVAIFDKMDNSSFTLKTYGTSSLMLVPQIRTSKASLVRFSKHLLDNFQEGNIVDFKA